MMFCEILFEINGSPEEQEAVALKIKYKFSLWLNQGDIANLSFNDELEAI